MNRKRIYFNNLPQYFEDKVFIIRKKKKIETKKQGGK